MNFAVGLKGGGTTMGDGTVKDVNRLEKNKAKLPESIKQLSFGCKLCDK